MNLQEKLRNLPDKSGVYIFRDLAGAVIYVGKASNLKNRVRQYFHDSIQDESSRHQWLVKSISDVEYIIVNSSTEALILEADLIKRHRPYFNVRMKDDKRYPYIEITTGEDYPRMRIVRKVARRASRYFGPYTDSRALRRVFRLIQKAFLVRTCKYNLRKKLPRPCLDYHINLCTAPCVQNITPEDYRAMVDRACSFLDGQSTSLLKSLEKELKEASDRLDYERCIVIRDLKTSVESILSTSPLLTKPGDDGDFIGAVVEDYLASVVLLQLRDGRTLGQYRHIMEAPGNPSPSQIMERFIAGNYRKGFFIPPGIFTSEPLPEATHIGEWLSGIRGRKVEILSPHRGQKRDIIKIVLDNAQEHLTTRSRFHREKLVKNYQDMAALQKLTGLAQLPRRIEGYDISNISGTLSVGSMVVFVNGEPLNSHYRHFRIATVDGPDDFAMMKEILCRRLESLKMSEMESFGEFPDLMLIDGGRGQLNAALSAVKSVGIDDLNIISIAKKEEEVYLPHRREPVKEDLSNRGLQLLQRVRDEAHRFAVSYHRKLQKHRMEVSILDGIPGISKKRKETLLQNFNSIEEIRSAGLYQLQEVPGFNRKVADAVLRYLGNNQP